MSMIQSSCVALGFSAALIGGIAKPSTEMSMAIRKVTRTITTRPSHSLMPAWGLLSVMATVGPLVRIRHAERITYALACHVLMDRPNGFGPLLKVAGRSM